MNGLDNSKKECLELFLLLLVQKYKRGEELKLFVSNQLTSTFYSYNNKHGHQIHISLLDFEIFTKYELCYILAHEFNHFLENENRAKRLQKEYLIDIFLFMLVSNLFLFSWIVIQINDLSFFWLLLFYPVFFILFSNPLASINSSKEESRCDHFANTEIGGGKRVFIMTEIFEQGSKLTLKEILLKIVKLNIGFRRYPKTSERITEASKYSLNENIKYFLDNYRFY